MEKNINELLIKPLRDIESLSVSERIKYYEYLREYCKEIGENNKTNITLTQRIMAKMGKRLRNFDFEMIGADNIPKDGCLIVCNHSNTHDAFVSAEFLYDVGLPSTFFASVEGLSALELALFNSARATMIDRRDKISTNNGLYNLSSKVVVGDTGVVFGESTWNMHPFKPMLNIKIGAVKIAAITNKPIVPIIIEYVEVPKLVAKEKDLYSKCIIKVGYPIKIDPSLSLIDQTIYVQTILENMRKDLWKELGTYREKKEDVNPEIYVNHTWLKKYGTPFLEYDSEGEIDMLYSRDGLPVENEYYIDEYGEFKPGIILKKSKIKGIY